MQENAEDLWTRGSTRHPSFAPPDDLNTRLWRYMSASRFRWLVENGRLYMPRPDQLASNDRREGTMPDAQAAWWHNLIAGAETSEKSARRRDNFERYNGFVASFRTSWFISCWHQSVDENFAFWRIYGRNESTCETCGRVIVGGAESVAIITTFRKLENLLPAHIEVGVVRYLDYKSEGDYLFNMYDYIMHKRHFYAYEAEVRAVASATATIAPGLAGEHINSNIVAGSYAPPVDVKALIEEVVVHPEVTHPFFEEIGALCEQHGLRAPRISGLANQA